MILFEFFIPSIMMMVDAISPKRRINVNQNWINGFIGEYHLEAITMVAKGLLHIWHI